MSCTPDCGAAVPLIEVLHHARRALVDQLAFLAVKDRVLRRMHVPVQILVVPSMAKTSFARNEKMSGSRTRGRMTG
jgi:hypothetical protein